MGILLIIPVTVFIFIYILLSKHFLAKKIVICFLIGYILTGVLITFFSDWVITNPDTMDFVFSILGWPFYFLI